MVFRHGQRSPYPPPHATSAAGSSPWASRQMPSIAAWNMTPEAFNDQWLTAHGKAQLRHMGQWFSQSLNVSSCDAHRAMLVADGSSFRDVQSARAFAAGFFPAACSAAQAAQIIVATEDSHPMLHPLANDHANTGCAEPTEKEIELSFGGNVAALTAIMRPEIERVGSLIGCCSPAVCAAHGLGARNCSLIELPTTFSGHYWSYYDGPLSVAAYYSNTFMLQVCHARDMAHAMLHMLHVCLRAYVTTYACARACGRAVVRLCIHMHKYATCRCLGCWHCAADNGCHAF